MALVLFAFPIDVFRDLFALPVLVFVALAVWLVRKAAKAARTERNLEEETRVQRALDTASGAPELHAVPEQLEPSAEPVSAPLSEPVVTELARRPNVRWVRLAGRHVAWVEERGAGEVLCVARVERGQLVDEQQFS